MARYQTTFSSNAVTQIIDVHRRRDSPSYEGTLIVQGTLGGGTITLLISGDKGVTYVPMPDVNGSLTGITVAGARNYRFAGDGGTFNGDAPVVAIQLAGATAPAITVIFFDNV